MKTILKIGVGIGAAIGCVMAVLAVEADRQSSARTGDNMSTALSAPVQLVRYIPPSGSRPTPKTRVGKGGSRGEPGAGSATVTLLVPEHVAYTSREQPTLYWHLSGSMPRPVVVTITGLEDVQPLLEKTLAGPHAAGIHAFWLGDYGARLSAGKTYRCTVQVIEKPDQPSLSDPLATAFVERKDSSKGAARIGQSDDALSGAQRYAEGGLWLDALDALFDNSGRGASDPKLMQARQALLEQVELRGLPVAMVMSP
jgi:hypothetical protein